MEACGPAPDPLLYYLGSCSRLTFLAEASPIAGEAKADEGVDLVDAGATVLTGARDAIVNTRGEGGAESEASLPWLPVQGNRQEDVVLPLPSTPDPRTLCAVVCP